jgi:activator of HSP90 ATPase
MPDTIEQTVTLPATAERLFAMYLDPVAHAAFTGAPVTIDATPGSAFSAFNGALCGTMLQTVPGRLIVQAWRSNHWAAEDLDSTLILTFLPDGGSGRIELVHANVAHHDVQGVTEGWEKYYWTPWKRYLQEQH